MARKHISKIDSKSVDRGGFISVKRAARHLDMSPKTVYAMIAARKITAVRIGRSVRIKTEDFLNYLDVHAQRA